VSWHDWLGCSETPSEIVLPLEEARAHVRKLGLTSQKAWHEWAKSGKRPPDIPSRPENRWRDKGWISWSDWLGSSCPESVKHLPFEEARAIVRELGFDGSEWRDWCKTGKRFPNIPYRPDHVYRGAGWVSMSDWLGTHVGNGGPKRLTMLPFEEARTHVRKQGLTSHQAWKVWCKSGKRPPTIPCQPNKVYRDAGWESVSTSYFPPTFFMFLPS
jgi:hypothetical protein